MKIKGLSQSKKRVEKKNKNKNNQKVNFYFVSEYFELL